MVNLKHKKEKIEETVEQEVTVEQGEILEAPQSDDKLAETTKQLEELTDRFQRLYADYDNYRKRTAKEKAAMFDEGIRAAVSAMLSSIDNLERALQAASEEEKAGKLYQGLDMTLKAMQMALSSLGVTVIPTVGEKFNPDLHNAVAHEQNDEYGENAVVRELQKGYMHKDRVIRHSMVSVAN